MGLESKIRRLCGILIFIQNSKIYFVHQTAKEFLIQNDIADSLRYIYSFHLRNADSLLAQICLTYLMMDDLQNDSLASGSNIQSFLGYSATDGADHVRNISRARQGK